MPNPLSSSPPFYKHLVPTLTDNNYATWKTEMEMLLIREGLWSIVSQRLLRLTVNSGNASSSSSSSRTRSSTAGLADHTNAAAAMKWDEDAERATATVFLYLDERTERCVEAIRNPVELWAKLKNLYERKGFSARFYFWQKLFTLQLADYRKLELKGNAMDLYLDAYRSHIQQLRSSGATVSNEIEASVLLNSLDKGYESFIVATTQSFRQTADAEIDVDQLVSQLRDEDRRRAAGQTTKLGDAGTGLALYSNPKRHRQSDKPRPTCNYCNREGHQQDDCWILHPELKPESHHRHYGSKRQRAHNARSNLITAGERDLI